MMPKRVHIRNVGPGQWAGVPVLAYKPEGTHFRDISRQVLVDAAEDRPMQLRYFEIAPGGHSTLERHLHTHAVLVLRGRGACLVGAEVHVLAEHDLVEVPPRTWHQFRATGDEPLGFLCLVAAERDRPERPGPADVEALRSLGAEVAEFLRL